VSVSVNDCCLVYLHGLHSSPQSLKAQQVRQYVSKRHQQCALHIPQLDYDPAVNHQVLFELFEQLSEAQMPIGIIGSSMGGFYGACLSKRFHVPAVLINPVVDPLFLLPQVYGQQVHPITGQQYCFGVSDQEKLRQWGSVVPDEANAILLCLGMRDETLPPETALQCYGQSEKIIEPNADHSFASFEHHLPKIFNFLFGS